MTSTFTWLDFSDGERRQVLEVIDQAGMRIPGMSWGAQLHHVLMQEIDPAAFERLVQRILRESGFVHVEVTGRSGDGGIDGKGIARISGMLSFHVIFQCKRY